MREQEHSEGRSEWDAEPDSAETEFVPDMKKQYSIVPDYILRDIAGEYVIIPTGEDAVISNAVMMPNRTAVFFWKTFQPPQTPENAVKAGMEMFEVDIETLQAAVLRFVSEGLRYRFIKEV